MRREMYNGLSKSIVMKIYRFSMKLRKENNIGYIKITELVNKKFRINFPATTISAWIYLNSIPFNKKLDLSRELLIELYCNKKLSIKQVANKLGIGSSSVFRHLSKYEIKTRNSKEGQKARLQYEGKDCFWNYIDEKLDDKQKQMILGTILGDGTLRLRGRQRNANLKIQHTWKDKKYIEYKYSVLKNFVAKSGIREDIRFNKGVKKYYKTFRFITVSHPEFTKFKKLFYNNYRKIVNNKILKQLKPYGLAIWVMDDGCYNKKGKFIDIYTMNFSYNEHVLLQKWFRNKYNLYPKINYHKQCNCYHLRFRVNDTKRLANIIKQYIIPSMRRKIGVSV